MKGLLVDGDVLVYMIGFSCEKEGKSFEEHRARVYEFIESLKESTGEDEVHLFLSGGTNFRKDLFEDYKLNRKGSHRPIFYDELREHLVDDWGAILSVDCEADDDLGMNQNDDTVICTIDKDLRMCSGWHYNWNHNDVGLEWISPIEAFRNFAMQCLTGDAVDNIPGLFKTTGRKAMPKIKAPLIESNSPVEMWSHIEELYGKEHSEELGVISKLLWIRHTHEIEDWMEVFNE